MQNTQALAIDHRYLLYQHHKLGSGATGEVYLGTTPLN